MNQLKTVFWLGLLTFLLMAAGDAVGGQQGMMMALLFALFMNGTAYFFSDRIVLTMYGAREVAPGEAPELFAIVQDLCGKAGIPMPRVAVINSPTPNAFATGRNPSHAVIAVTTGIMNILDREELAAVIGHELSHVKNRDILVSSVAAVLAGAIGYLAQMGQFSLMFGGRASDDDEGGSGIGTILMVLLAPIAAAIVQMAVSRSREYLADESGAHVSGRPLALARALQKLEMAAHRIPMHADPATAHMFIVNPLHGGGFSSLFSTHPATEDRVEALQRIAAEMGARR